MRAKLLGSVAALVLAGGSLLASGAPASAQPAWDPDYGWRFPGAFAADVVGGAVAAATSPLWGLGDYDYYPGYAYAPPAYAAPRVYDYAPGYAYAPPAYAAPRVYDYSPGYAYAPPAYAAPRVYDYSPGYAYAPPAYAAPRIYDYSPGYTVAPPPPAYTAPTTEVVQNGPRPGDIAYCQGRYRTYNVSTGMFVGYDGRQHPCP